MQTPLTIVDHRLNSAQGSIIDLRTAPAAAPQPSITPEVDSDN
jgi:hypothetical protein